MANILLKPQWVKVWPGFYHCVCIVAYLIMPYWIKLNWNNWLCHRAVIYWHKIITHNIYSTHSQWQSINIIFWIPNSAFEIVAKFQGYSLTKCVLCQLCPGNHWPNMSPWGMTGLPGWPLISIDHSSLGHFTTSGWAHQRNLAKFLFCLTLYVLNFSEETKTYIYISCHSSTLTIQVVEILP